MAESAIASFMDEIIKKDKAGVVTSIKELRENQFGIPLRHYAQWYLFGATGLRLKVFHSIGGIPQSCKSPLLMDLMGHVCASREIGGLGGIAFLYELEDKISATLLSSVTAPYGDVVGSSLRVVKDMTLEGAMEHLATQVIPAYKKNIAKMNIPLIIGMDSIGGSASKDTADKISSDGAAGKGYYNKAHYMKYFCENAGVVIDKIPMVVIAVNQEKEAASATGYGPPQKKITGGASQVFKDGHMISCKAGNLTSGDGKIIYITTTKTSFCDSRKIEVIFRWNKFGNTLDDMYGHHFEWALASAKCLADPTKGVGDLRQIADVKISDQGLVTCPELGVRSVPPEEFEMALMDPSNSKILEQLMVHQKIERIKSVDEYAAWLKDRKAAAKEEDKPKEEPKPKAAAKKPKAAAKKEANGAEPA